MTKRSASPLAPRDHGLGETPSRGIRPAFMWGAGNSVPAALVATGMAFDDVVRQLDVTRVVAVITRRRDGTRVATPIWAMVVDGVPYLRSAYGPGSWWYRHALSGRKVAFALGDGALAERDREAALDLPSETVGLESIAADDPVQARIDAELGRKYASEPASIAEMKTPGAMATTLRVVAVGTGR